MKAIRFPGCNVIMNRPPDMTAEECDNTHAFRGEDKTGAPVIITCWELNEEELAKINETKKLYVWVMGHGMPPIALDADAPFNIPPQPDVPKHASAEPS